MQEFLIGFILVAFVFLLMRRIRRLHNRPDSKLTYNQHPSTFKKPEIEMVNPHKQDSESVQDNFKHASPPSAAPFGSEA